MIIFILSGRWLVSLKEKTISPFSPFRHVVTFVGCLACVFGGQVRLEAALLAFEGFEDYQTGALLGGLNGGTGWDGAWSSGDVSPFGIRTVVGGLSYVAPGFSVYNLGGSTALQITYSTGDSNAFMTRPFPVQTGTVYMSMLWQTSTADGGSDEDFIQFGLDPGVLNPRASFLHRRNGSLGDHVFQARSGTGSGPNGTVGTNPGETYFLVIRASDTNADTIYDRVELWINPTSQAPGTPNLIHNANSGISSVQQFIGRLAFLEPGDTYIVDNLRIGTNFLAVIPIPEPGTAALALFGAAALGLRRRLAPLSRR